MTASASPAAAAHSDTSPARSPGAVPRVRRTSSPSTAAGSHSMPQTLGARTPPAVPSGGGIGSQARPRAGYGGCRLPRPAAGGARDHPHRPGGPGHRRPAVRQPGPARRCRPPGHRRGRHRAGAAGRTDGRPDADRPPDVRLAAGRGAGRGRERRAAARSRRRGGAGGGPPAGRPTRDPARRRAARRRPRPGRQPGRARPAGPRAGPVADRARRLPGGPRRRARLGRGAGRGRGGGADRPGPGGPGRLPAHRRAHRAARDQAAAGHRRGAAGGHTARGGPGRGAPAHAGPAGGGRRARPARLDHHQRGAGAVGTRHRRRRRARRRVRRRGAGPAARLPARGLRRGALDVPAGAGRAPGARGRRPPLSTLRTSSSAGGHCFRNRVASGGPGAMLAHRRAAGGTRHGPGTTGRARMGRHQSGSGRARRPVLWGLAVALAVVATVSAGGVVVAGRSPGGGPADRDRPGGSVPAASSCERTLRVVTASSFAPVLSRVQPGLATGPDCVALDTVVVDGREAAARVAEREADVWIPDDASWAGVARPGLLAEEGRAGAGTVLATSPIYLVTDRRTAARLSAAGGSWLALADLVATPRSGVRIAVRDPNGSGDGMVAAGSLGEAVWGKRGMDASSAALSSALGQTRTVPGAKPALPERAGEVGLVPEHALLAAGDAASAPDATVLAGTDKTALLRYAWLPRPPRSTPRSAR